MACTFIGERVIEAAAASLGGFDTASHHLHPRVAGGEAGIAAPS